MLPQSMFPVVANPECECPPRIVAYEGTPDDGDILVYDATTDTWGPAAPNPGDITAVNTNLPLTGGAASGSVTLDINNFTGDAGAGGLDGAVPAPAAGDAAAGKFLKADGTWAVPPAGGGISVLANVVDNASVFGVQSTEVDVITSGAVACAAGKTQEITVTFTVYFSTAMTTELWFKIYADAAVIHGFSCQKYTNDNLVDTVTVTCLATGLAAGNHTFKLTMRQGNDPDLAFTNTFGSADTPTRLIVKEY